MDLIYMNAAKEELGVLQGCDLDLAFGEDENSFECKVAAPDHCCEAGYFLFIEGTEYGGIVDSVQIDTENNEVTYSGRTWHGILASKIILPLQEGETSEDITVAKTESTDDGEGRISLVNRYLRITGEANRCIQFIIERIGLSTMFKAAVDQDSEKVNGYKFDRYTDAYAGICKMLKKNDMKLRVSFEDGLVVLAGVPRYDFSQDEEFTSDGLSFVLKRSYNTVNHLICLGSGEMEARKVVHLYADADGKISDTQTFTGEDEYAATFDYSNVESEEELIKGGEERLKSLWEQNELSISFEPDEDVYDLGDIVGAYDNVTKTAVVAEINKKIVTIKNGKVTISYKVGEK